MAGATGGGGARIAFRTAGDPQGPPIVFVHGWAASSESWAGQLSDQSLSGHWMVAVDLRGHGASSAPSDGYDDPAVWAADLAGVLAGLGRPAVLVGWSYGGLVVTDYLRERGTAGVAGVVYAGAVTELGRDRPGGAIGPAWDGVMRPMMSEDPDEAIPALTAFAKRMTVEPLPGPDLQRHVGNMLRVPPRVRKALFKRDLGSADVLAAIDVPVLIAHGTADTVVAPSSAEYAAGKISTATVRWFEEVGHMPFVERRAEFNAALLEFAGPVANH
ncbi:alpha/beta fold hydrolase [Actinophytocola sp. KF-1]